MTSTTRLALLLTAGAALLVITSTWPGSGRSTRERDDAGPFSVSPTRIADHASGWRSHRADPDPGPATPQGFPTPGPRSSPVDERPISMEHDPDLRFPGIPFPLARPAPEEIEALGQALEDAEADVRWTAFRAVADMAFRGIDAPGITSLLLQALSDPDPAMRSEAVDALAQRGPEGLRIAERALDDSAEEVCERAAALLLAGSD